jgi:hypothetical protein
MINLALRPGKDKDEDPILQHASSHSSYTQPMKLSATPRGNVASFEPACHLWADVSPAVRF